jgi:Transposase IS116/IS110/IS902 family
MLHRTRQLLVRQRTMLSNALLARQYSAIGTEIASIDKNIMVLHRACEASRRLAEIPGIGPIGATALVAEIGDWKAFGSGRSLAAWIGLVPKQHTTGGKDRLGSITKQGNRYLRWLLVVGAMAVIRYARKHGTAKRPWLGRLMERRPTKVAAVALANKIARMAWAIMVRDERQSAPLRRRMSYVANAIPIGGARIADMASFGDLIKVLSREPKLFPHFGEARTAIFLVQEIEYDERFSATESAEARDRPWPSAMIVRHSNL